MGARPTCISAQDGQQCSQREIRWMVVQHGDSLRSVSRHLQGRFPGVAGLSIRSVRRFCSSCGIHYRSTLGEGELDELVRSRVGSVGHSYGRRSLQGLLRAEGINPILYRAEFFGEKIQNEKIVMYGVVHVVAVDGYSRKIVGFCTMSRKNPITILGTIF